MNILLLITTCFFCLLSIAFYFALLKLTAIVSYIQDIIKQIKKTGKITPYQLQEIEQLLPIIERTKYKLKIIFGDTINPEDHIPRDMDTECQLPGQWISVADDKPETKIISLVFGGNKILRAFYVPRYTIEDDNDWDEGEYYEEKNKKYVIEGWYEFNNYEDNYWLIPFEITHWMPLPDVPFIHRMTCSRPMKPQHL